jgi:hypothetical protein
MKRPSASNRRKLKFLLDRDASGTAGAIASMGWRSFAVTPQATEPENARQAIQRGLSILSMDADFAQLSLRALPFTVILGGNAQQSMTTATAQIQHLHRLIRVGEIQPTLHQRVTINSEDAKVELWDGNSIKSRRIAFRPRRRSR